MVYYHVDVFSDKPLYGNGLTVVFLEKEYGTETLLRIAQEFKQFETVFVYPEHHGVFPIRIFTVQEELPFAGHPIIGTAAVLHKIFDTAAARANIKIGLGKRIISLESKKQDASFSVTMNQGKPDFGMTLTADEAAGLSAYFNLRKDDLNADYPAEVVSTGLPYILLPLKKNLETAKIVKTGLESYIEQFSAKFVYLFNTETLQCRCWDNTGAFEDAATGSAAGPLTAYLVHHAYKKTNEVISISQGEYIGRPSIIRGWVSDTNVYNLLDYICIASYVAMTVLLLKYYRQMDGSKKALRIINSIFAAAAAVIGIVDIIETTITTAGAFMRFNMPDIFLTIHILGSFFKGLIWLVFLWDIIILLIILFSKKKTA